MWRWVCKTLWLMLKLNENAIYEHALTKEHKHQQHSFSRTIYPLRCKLVPVMQSYRACRGKALVKISAHLSLVRTHSKVIRSFSTHCQILRSIVLICRVTWVWRLSFSDYSLVTALDEVGRWVGLKRWAIGTLQLLKQSGEDDCRARQANSLIFVILSDNGAVHVLLKAFSQTQAIKHLEAINVRMRQWIREKLVSLDSVRTGFNWADCLTKTLPRTARELCNWNGHAP